MTQVFISYSRKDLVFVERLAKDLEAAGLEVWYDLSGLEVGTRWGREIQNALDQSQYFLVVLSPNSVDSEWVEKEFLYANNLKTKIIPLLFAPCRVPMWFINLHFIDVQGENYERHLPELLKALGIQTGKAINKVEALAVAPSHQEPAEEKQQIHQDFESGKKQASDSRRKSNFSAKWIILPLLLLALIAFAAWGLPPLAARLAPTRTPTVTIAQTPTHNPTGASPHPSNPTYTLTSTSLPTLSAISKIRPKDGMTMVSISAGKFIMGSDSGDPDAQSAHAVSLDAYWIDQTEVTNAMVAQCVQAGTCQTPADTASYFRSSYYGNARYATFPVILVDWNLAKDYCAWAEARLPTEAEWEKVARGTDGRSYPWGNASPTCLLANFSSCFPADRSSDTNAVGTHLPGASPYGVLDMAGNVQEWVSDWYSATYYSSSPASNPPGPASGSSRVVRGGYWNDPGSALKTFVRFRIDPSMSDHYTGFRCARDAAP